MAAKTGKAPAELRRQVCSPGGTTLAGLAAMQEKGFDEAVAAGVRAARDRSAELAR
jgi:pyrroline-5-carboxylate reductase